MKLKRLGLSKASVKDGAREFVDYDYLSQLTKEELNWLDLFSREYYNNDLTHDESVHQAPFKRLYTQHNARNRDIWNCNRRVDKNLEGHTGGEALPKALHKKDINE